VMMSCLVFMFHDRCNGNIANPHGPAAVMTRPVPLCKAVHGLTLPDHGVSEG
jgi:hypothetical protein